MFSQTITIHAQASRTFVLKQNHVNTNIRKIHLLTDLWVFQLHNCWFCHNWMKSGGVKGITYRFVIFYIFVCNYCWKDCKLHSRGRKHNKPANQLSHSLVKGNHQGWPLTRPRPDTLVRLDSLLTMFPKQPCPSLKHRHLALCLQAVLAVLLVLF